MLATVLRWADEDSAALRRLVEDEDLRARVRAALEGEGDVGDR